MKIITNSPEETESLGLKLAKKSKGGDIFVLTGQLGGGKTCFTKGFAKGLGVKETLNSPSFILMKVYKIKKGPALNFCHVDCYRLKRAGEIAEIGLGEYLGNKNSITIIEWAGKIKNILSSYKKEGIHFTFVDQNSRKIEIKKVTN